VPAPVLATQELTLDASVRHSPPTKHSRGFALSAANGSAFSNGADARGSGSGEAPDGSFGSLSIGHYHQNHHQHHQHAIPHTALSDKSAGSLIGTAPHSAIPVAAMTGVSTPLVTAPA
jgi:hypothetical protein